MILHSITSKQKWNKVEQLSEARWDIIVNILIGGLITFSILVISATVLRGSELKGNPALIFTQSLEPVLGKYASLFGNLGLFAAGLSSAIAIPFTLKNITAKVLNFKDGADDIRAKILGVIVVVFGSVLAIVGRNPQEIIVFAQATSGISLPIIAILILIVSNNKKLLGKYVNNPIQNLVGVVVVILTFALGAKGLYDGITGFIKLLG